MAETSDEQGWHYLDANNQSQGPFPVSYLHELDKAKYFAAETLFWREGQEGWKPLAALADLSAALKLAAAAAAPANVAPGPSFPAAGAATAADGDGDPLAGFFSEIHTIEKAHAEAEAAEGEQPPSPDPEDRQFTDDDGTSYEWSSVQRKFVPVGGLGVDIAVPAIPVPVLPEYRPEDMVYVPEEDAAAHRRKSLPPPPAAAVEENNEGGGNGDEAEEAAVEEEVKPKGRKDKRLRDREAALEAARKRAKAATDEQEGWAEMKSTTSVYVTGLPDDVTVPEIVETFGKCGVIKEDLDTNEHKVKLYRDAATGLLKGDGLVTYLKEPSVGLATTLLDGTPFRYGLTNMTVTRAKFEQKGAKYVAPVTAAAKKKKKKAAEQQEKRALGWKGFDDTSKPQDVTVVLKHMFSPEDFLLDPKAKQQELEDDVTAEAAKLGTVNNVRVFRGNPEGVITVRFSSSEAADACVALMHGRWFAGRRVAAGKWDGATKFNVKVEETAEEQQARLERYAAEIEAQEKAKKANE